MPAEPAEQAAQSAADTAMGFGHFLSQADGLAKAILILMLLASIASWDLIVSKAGSNWLAQRRSARFLDFFWNAPSLGAVAARLEDRHPDEPFSHLAYHGIAASHHHERHERDGDTSLLSTQHKKCFTEPRQCEYRADSHNPPIRCT
ncbi:MAG: hypothetical protein J0I90_01125 [Nitrosospira sp.]|nr:hypothetical protein [Nitrosospira sp.]